MGNLGNRAPALSSIDISHKIILIYCVGLKVLAVYMLTLRTYLCLLLIKYLYSEYGRYIIQYICICLGPRSQNTFVLMKESCVKSCMSPWVLSFWLQPLVKPPLLRPETSASRKSLLANGRHDCGSGTISHEIP